MSPYIGKFYPVLSLLHHLFRLSMFKPIPSNIQLIFVAHLIKDSPKSKGPPKIVDQEVTTRGIAASNTKKVPQPAKIACKLDSKATKSAVPSEKVDPLDAYLNDMDDDEIPKKKKKSLPSKGARVDSIATSLPEIPAARVKNSGTEASKSKTNHNDENITKFPEVEMNLQNKYTGKNMEKDRAIKIVAPCSREKPSPYLANPKKNEKSSRKANNSKSYEAVIQSPTLLNVQHKLQALEKALAEQREVS